MDEPEIDYIYNDTTCNNCFAEFLDLEDLEIHRIQVHSVGILDCQFCEQKLRSIEDYAEHIRDTHLTDMKACLYCSRLFTNENYCKRHEKKHISHLSTAKYSCSQCDMQFNYILNLEKHEFNMHKEGDATRGLWLQDCLPHLSSILNMSLKSVLIEGKSKFVCAKCRAVSLSLEDYTQHLKNENCRSLCCNTCSSVYKSKKSLYRHFNIHSECNYESKNYTKKCSECLKDFPLHSWKYHQKSCKTVKCQVCQIVFETLDDLAQHQTEKHPLVISVQVCKFCQKEFVGTVGLNKHIERTHNLEQYKYRCVYCEIFFKHPKKLFAHLFTKHKDIEPYFCSLCQKSFRIRKSFTIHIKLVHKSVGSVEFDEKFNVFFKEKISKPNDESVTNNNELDSIQINENTEAENVNCGDTSIGIQSQSLENAIPNRDDQDKETLNFLATDTEAPTDNETQQVEKPLTKKLREVRSAEIDITIDSSASDSSDDQTLLAIRKKLSQRRKYKKKNSNKSKKNRFICQYCNKQCHTFHNYHNHLNTAHQNEKVKCIKCSKSFGSRQKLAKHIAKEHSSSKLTETLKKVLAKRSNKSSETNTLTVSEKFERTIKRVNCSGPEEPEEPAILKSKELSVQKFIESFTPESGETKKNIEISSNISIKTVFGATKSSFIKMTKFEPKPSQARNLRSKLAMPVRFKQDNSSERNDVTVKVVTIAPQSASIDQYDDQDVNKTYFDNDDNYDHYEEVTEEKTDYIPEVAQEVMLGGSEEVAKPKTEMHKVVIPNITKEMSQVRIATVLPEAPYYKIIKISEVLKDTSKETKDEGKKEIILPNGKKLVSVNPLAHLLGDTQIKKIIGENKKKKYYQPKVYDFETAIANALMKTPVRQPRKKRKISKVEP